MNHDAVMFDLLVRAYIVGKSLEFKNKTNQTLEGNKTNLI